MAHRVSKKNPINPAKEQANQEKQEANARKLINTAHQRYNDYYQKMFAEDPYSEDPDNNEAYGLGTINPINNPQDPRNDKAQRSTIFDGYGNFTYPYRTDQRYINRRYISFHAFFYTQEDEYDAYYVLGRKDAGMAKYGNQGNVERTVHLTNEHRQHQFSQTLIGFDTDNDGTEAIPTMKIKLFGYRDWEQILRPNDYVALRIHESFPDQPSLPVKKRTLMTGLISNINFTENSESSGRIYTISCQGMQKVLANVHLGLPNTASANDAYLIFDINGNSNPKNETFEFGSAGNGDDSSEGTAKETGSQVEKGIIRWCNDHGFSKNETAGVLASCQIESQMGQANNGHNLLGISSNNVGVGQKEMSSYDYMNMFSKESGRVSGWKDSHKSSSAYDCGKSWGEEIEADTAHDDSERGEIAEKFAKEI